MKKFFSLIVFFLISSCQNVNSMPESNLSIGDIQGCSHVSPYAGKNVNGLTGVITHKFKNGFSMQSLNPDTLDCTSDGIFVTTGDYPDVLTGDLVSVNGLINEYVAGNVSDHNLSRTEIISSRITILKSSVPFPEPIVIGQRAEGIPLNWIKEDSKFDITRNGLDYYESLEFTLVEISEGIVVGPKNYYNEFYILPNAYIEKNVLSSEGALLQKEDDENPEKIMVDTPSSFTQKVNVGDLLTEPVTGIMIYEYANYKLWSASNPPVRSVDKYPRNVFPGNNSLSVASYNIENFSRFDDESKVKKIGCQVVQDLGAPDIILLQEVMDDSGTQDDQTISAEKTLQLITRSIRNCHGPVYTFVDNPPINNQDGGIQGGNIRIALLFRKDANISFSTSNDQINNLNTVLRGLTIRRNPGTLFIDENVFAGTRKPLLWNFIWEGQEFIIIGLHLVSQSAKSPDWGNIQPPDNPEQVKRQAQMMLVAELVKKLLQEHSNRNIIVIGDMNDYQWSNTLQILKDADLFFLSEESIENFSYIHEGNAFQFDYAAVSPHLVDKIANYSIPHINTLNDTDKQVSDHDPLYFEISQK